MTNLPSLYARVVAKRPDLAVKIDRGEGCEQRIERGWDAWQYNTYYGDDRQIVNFTSDEIAAALILARWVEALPVNHHLSYDMNDDEQKVWRVFKLHEASGRFEAGPDRNTPIEALAAFYLGETT